MIKTLTSKRKRKLISTYDFEWYKGEREAAEDGKYRRRPRLRLCGFYDERGYWCTETIEDFATRVLVPENCGRRLYAHFGGASDMVFLLKELAKDKSLSMRGLFSSSSCIYLRVERGTLAWEFLDSFWTMRASLKDVGEWTGNPKLECDTETAPLAELIDYNEQDCKVLWDALQGFQDIVWDAGGELCATGASTSLNIYLRKYHKKPIQNSPAIDAFMRPGYVASRVEVIREKCRQANYYDINSSFPYSMTFPLPGSLISWGDRIPKRHNALWAAECDVTVPEDSYFPPIPYKTGGRVFFPVGSFRTTITSEDMLCGGFTVDKVHQCLTFDDHTDLAEFAEHMYSLRQRGGFEGRVFKIIVNSAYGKFAEREEKRVLLINPERRDVATQEMVSPGIYIGAETVEIPHAHVPFSAFTTARSRRFLYEYGQESLRHGKLYYLDTDALTCDHIFKESKALGGLKLEGKVTEGRFFAPKLYAYMGEDGEAVVKAKGFSRKVSEGGEKKDTRLTYEDFISLVNGEKLRIERMLRIRELVRRDGWDYEPETLEHDKTLRLTQISKRRGLPNGNTAPWHIDDLISA